MTTNATELDPTKNVRELVIAEARRLDEHRAAEAMRVNEAIAAMRRENDLREHYRHLLSDKEAARIDANRATDLAAVGMATERAAGQATVLATQVSRTAEALQASTDRLTAALSERTTALERSNYEGRGKSDVVDPMMAELVAEMKRLSAAGAVTGGAQQGRGELWKALSAGAALLLTLAGFVWAISQSGGVG